MTAHPWLPTPFAFPLRTLYPTTCRAQRHTGQAAHKPQATLQKRASPLSPIPVRLPREYPPPLPPLDKPPHDMPRPTDAQGIPPLDTRLPRRNSATLHTRRRAQRHTTTRHPHAGRIDAHSFRAHPPQDTITIDSLHTRPPTHEALIELRATARARRTGHTVTQRHQHSLSNTATRTHSRVPYPPHAHHRTTTITKTLHVALFTVRAPKQKTPPR